MPVEQAICNDADIGTPLNIIRVDLSTPVHVKGSQRADGTQQLAHGRLHWSSGCSETGRLKLWATSSANWPIKSL